MRWRFEGAERPDTEWFEGTLPAVGERVTFKSGVAFSERPGADYYFVAGVRWEVLHGDRYAYVGLMALPTIGCTGAAFRLGVPEEPGLYPIANPLDPAWRGWAYRYADGTWWRSTHSGICARSDLLEVPFGPRVGP